MVEVAIKHVEILETAAVVVAEEAIPGIAVVVEEVIQERDQEEITEVAIIDVETPEVEDDFDHCI